jgi:RNA polymerase primary sigma factor
MYDKNALDRSTGTDIKECLYREIRQYSILLKKEEYTLAVKISDSAIRMRRALYFSPIAKIVIKKLLKINPVLNKELGPRHKKLIKIMSKFKTAHNSPDQKITRREQIVMLHEWIKTWEEVREILHKNRKNLDRIFLQHFSSQSCEKSQKLYTLAEARYLKSRDAMLNANMRIALEVAQKYAGSALPYLDRVQEGAMGLVKAIGKFDPKRNIKFITYGWWWARQAIGRACVEQRDTIRYPNHVMELHFRIRREIAKFYTLKHREPTYEEISSILNKSIEEIQIALNVDMPMIRLNAQEQSDDLMLEEIISDNTPSHDEIMGEKQLELRVEQALNLLDEKSADILRKRFGLGCEPNTLKQVGDIYGLSRERIRQLELEAKMKLQNNKEVYDLLKDFVEV